MPAVHKPSRHREGHTPRAEEFPKVVYSEMNSMSVPFVVGTDGPLRQVVIRDSANRRSVVVRIGI